MRNDREKKRTKQQTNKKVDGKIMKQNVRAKRR